jgi:hypothetical protein
MIDLQEPRLPDSGRGMASWYLHGADLGYTHRGQVLGAAIGPGADPQRVTLDVFGPEGRIGGFLERVRRNELYYFQAIDPLPGEEDGHDAELTAGVRQVLFAGPVDVAWELSASYRWNRDFFGDEPNFRGAVTLTMPSTGRGLPKGATPRQFAAMSVTFTLLTRFVTNVSSRFPSVVAEEEHAAGFAAGEAGAEHRVGALLLEDLHDAETSRGWYSRSASWMIEIAPVACESAVWICGALAAVAIVLEEDPLDLPAPSAAALDERIRSS